MWPWSLVTAWKLHQLTALHGRGNARLAWFLARVAVTLVTVGRRRSARDDTLGWVCVLWCANGLRGARLARVGLFVFPVPCCAHTAQAPLALGCCCVR